MSRYSISSAIVGIAFLLAAQALAQEKKENQPGGTASAEKSGAKTPANEEYAVPEGTPEELVEFIKKIRNLPQDDETRKTARAAMLKAAEKILADKPGEDELDFAVDVKSHALDKPEDIAAFSEVLKKAGHEKQARAALGHSLEIALRIAVLSGKPDLLKTQTAAVMKYFKEAPPQPSDLGLAIMTGQIAELQGDNAYTQDVYRALSKAFIESKDQSLADFGKRLEGVVRRLSLVGHKMQLEGKSFSGEAFDFSKYQGKVVLIEFWVSWRQACAAEISKLRTIYDQYHDQGFEIIGFACDYRREDAEKFLHENDMPWATIYGEKGPSPTFEYYGIMTFPTGILIGKDGSVIALNVNADELAKQLEKLLGPAK